MRCIALDVHRDFCEVAVAAQGQVEHTGRIETSVGSLELFAGSLASDDQVVPGGDRPGVCDRAHP
jgi:hypothetical protein